MAEWDSASLVARLRAYVRRPTTDEVLSNDAAYYSLLSEAHNEIVADVAAMFPMLLMGAPTLMSTDDNGATWFFGTDGDGDRITPIGHCEVYTSNGGVELYGSTYAGYEGDVVFEGDHVRIPAGRTRTFTAGPYARFVTPPADLAAGVQPILKPKQSRELIVWKAAANAMLMGGLRDPSPFEDRYDRAWLAWCNTWATQWAHQQANGLAGVDWWRRLRGYGGTATDAGGIWDGSGIFDGSVSS